VRTDDPRNENLTETLQVRFTHDEKRMVEEISGLADESQSQVVRHAFLEKWARQLVS
jgi:hypothetical protein